MMKIPRLSLDALPERRERRTAAIAVATEGLSMTLEQLLARMRAVCLGWPEVYEVAPFGDPTFRAGTRTFATIDPHAGRPSVVVKADHDMQRVLVGQHAQAYVPHYTGRFGWVGFIIDEQTDWVALEALLLGAYRSVSTRRMREALDAVVV
jgi:predicted DNA-binding protein (MmcQ/YjbR family)